MSVSGAAPVMSASTLQELAGFPGRALTSVCLPSRRASAWTASVWHPYGGSSGTRAGPSTAYYFHVQDDRLSGCRQSRSRLSLVTGRGAGAAQWRRYRVQSPEGTSGVAKAWAFLRAVGSEGAKA